MVTCKSTRYGKGCGHPTTEHDGRGECCCCNWNHNDPGHVMDCPVCQERFDPPQREFGWMFHAPS